MNTWKRKPANKEESAAKKWKVITLEAKFESNVNEVVEEPTDPGSNSDTDTLWEASVGLGEGKLTRANEGRA